MSARLPDPLLEPQEIPMSKNRQDIKTHDGTSNRMLETSVAGIKLLNPFILASGILGETRASLERVARSGAGARRPE